MNCIELKEVLKIFGLNNSLLTEETTCCWRDIKVFFSNADYAIIVGKIPLEVANIVYQKYPMNPYGIMINGDKDNCIPSKYLIDDEYVSSLKDIDRCADENERRLLRTKERRRLSRRKDDYKYIALYHVYTKEGVVILLTELMDYYARKQGLPETEVQRFDEIMEVINSRILEEVTPNISIEEWMRSNEIYRETISRYQDDIIGAELRKKINDFDKVINPFINENVQFDDVGNYIKRVEINADVYDCGDIKRCSHVIIRDLETKNSVSFFRMSSGFIYQLRTKLGDRKYLDVIHSFFCNDCDEDERGELITIKYYGDETVEFVYNITRGIFRMNNERTNPVTIEQLIIIYNELVNAIGYASSITIANMCKNKDVITKCKRTSDGIKQD